MVSRHAGNGAPKILADVFEISHLGHKTYQKSFTPIKTNINELNTETVNETKKCDYDAAKECKKIETAKLQICTIYQQCILNATQNPHCILNASLMHQKLQKFHQKLTICLKVPQTQLTSIKNQRQLNK